MLLLVTRPQPQAAQWVDALRARGIEAEALPLIAIEPVDDAAPLQAAWRALDTIDLVVFVSPNAVWRFFGERPEDAAWPPRLRAATPGPGSAAALREAGVGAVVEPSADAPQFDSESLWARLSRDEWHGRRALVVRGDGGRDWLADRLREAGAGVEFVQAYRRGMPSLTAAQRERIAAACRAPREHLWHFSSSQAIDHLEQLAPAACWSQAEALASHPRIAARAQALGIARVTAVAPALDAVVATLQSRRP